MTLNKGHLRGGGAEWVLDTERVAEGYTLRLTKFSIPDKRGVSGQKPDKDGHLT